jgi:elongation factor Tu
MFVNFLRLVMQLFKPMVLEQGQRFTIRDGGVTLGTGVVTKILPRLPEAERNLLTEGKKAREKYFASLKEKEEKKK